LDLIRIYFGYEKYELIRNRVAQELEPLHVKLNNQMVLEDESNKEEIVEEFLLNTTGIHSFSNFQHSSNFHQINDTINYELNTGIQHNSFPYKN
jgi:hypothetical protein